MKQYRFAMLLMVAASTLLAQKQKFTMAEAVNGLRTNLAVKNLSKVSWEEGSRSYLQSVKDAYLSTKVPSMKADTLLTLRQLNRNFEGAELLTRLPDVTFLNSRSGYYRKDNRLVKLQRTAGEWKATPWMTMLKDAENVTVITEKDAVVYTVKNNLYWQNGERIVQITHDADENVINGQAVHRNEFGIDGGIFISPDKSKIAFYRMDQTMVADYPIIDWSVTPAVNTNIKYPMAGQISHQVSIGVFDTKTQSKQFLQVEGPKDQYLTTVAWTPDSKNIITGVLNRGQNHLKMNMYHASGGGFLKTLFEEKNDKYVEPQHAVQFLPGSDKEYIWQSQRDGFNHLYLYDLDKGLVKQLTSGNWLVTDMLGFNPKKNEVFFASTKESPLEKHLYKLNYKTVKLTRLDAAPGVHTGVLSHDGELLYDTYVSAEVPRRTDVINTSTLQRTNILSADNPLINYDRPKVELVNLRADDGTPLYGKLILPTDFDPAKKYPVIVYLYNGPHVQLVTNGFPASGNLWYEYLAQRGYIVFTMDGRGSANRGYAFESAPFRQLGTVEMEDQLKGVEFLQSLPYVDTTRLGVHGWSFGGFMTTSLMLRHPGVFKVGVAGGPVMDWNMYEIMYTERYMDSPQENPDGYAQAALFDKIKNLNGNLLLIHGTDDDVVLWQHSINMLRSAVDNNVQLDYFVYPGHKHNVLGGDRVHLMQKVTDYFDEHLK
ncbi:MAG: S9 family peptidase [Chryseobacterium sp.]|nr:MAG: S9 family peptidase [Chryseobacterium sp.]